MSKRNKSKLEIAIEETKNSIKSTSYKSNFITNDTELILKNQLVIMETLSKLIKK